MTQPLLKTEFFESDPTEKNYECQYYLLDGKEVLHGKEKFWYEPGKREGDLNYEHGVEHGTNRWFYPNGDLMWAVEYNQGAVISGNCYKHGMIQFSSIRNGNGSWIEYEPSECASVIYYCEYHDGLRHGLELNYHDHGAVYCMRLWERGKLLVEREY